MKRDIVFAALAAATGINLAEAVSISVKATTLWKAPHRGRGQIMRSNFIRVIFNRRNYFY
ncbi:hypothetical protein [Rhodoblastus acidophilus]|uniref:hypothetical protein n=1 Tax=Rhodoblastus acidophilus TaxID=1074 RepID=UPI001130131B|nr:hypothetical protein [Rhodoblastus acidophilus]